MDDKSFDRLYQNNEKILHILNGNGEPTKGLVYKVEKVYDWIELHNEQHRRDEECAKEQEEQKSERVWDVVSGIIKWVTPFVVYGIVTWLFQVFNQLGL